jgi:hypothetical protein
MSKGAFTAPPVATNISFHVAPETETYNHSSSSTAANRHHGLKKVFVPFASVWARVSPLGTRVLLVPIWPRLIDLSEYDCSTDWLFLVLLPDRPELWYL